MTTPIINEDAANFPTTQSISRSMCSFCFRLKSMNRVNRKRMAGKDVSSRRLELAKRQGTTPQLTPIPLFGSSTKSALPEFVPIRILCVYEFIRFPPTCVSVSHGCHSSPATKTPTRLHYSHAVNHACLQQSIEYLSCRKSGISNRNRLLLKLCP